jgi:signal transduction histidine kinase
MLRRLNVRARLVAVVAVPVALVMIVVVLLVVTSSGSGTLYLALTGAGVLLAAVLALAVAHSIARPLAELTVAVDQLASDRLPSLAAAARRSAVAGRPSSVPDLATVDLGADDELGRLARSVSQMQATAVTAAAEQVDVLNKGISELYVNLARRNQALLDRQIQLLDELERSEEDPTALRHLYLLDHLSTRMRRNAESLLVLAGSGSGHRRSKPISMVDVVRAALSEIEDYPRIELGSMAEATLLGPVVSDVAHLLAELLENATQLSPPSTSVRVDGARVEGGYDFTIADEGVGMPAEQMEALNLLLREPPASGLATGRSLGCLVAARLAARHGISVRLASGERHGVVATVAVPTGLLVVDVATPPPPHPPDAGGGPTTELHARLHEALPAQADFEADLRTLFEQESAPVAAGPIAVPRGPFGVVVPTRPRRQPRVAASPPARASATPAKRRSPDEVRSVLVQYRSGIQAGRRAAGPIDEERS